MKRIIVAMSLVILGISGCASLSDGQAYAGQTAPADENLKEKQSPFPQNTVHGAY